MSKPADTPRVLVAKVSEVTLMEDRARVLRRGSTTLSAGRHTLHVNGVAPVLVDKSLVVEAADSKSKLRVVDARVVREMVIRTESGKGADDAREELVTLRAERRNLEGEMRSAAAEIQRCGDFGDGLQEVGNLTLSEIVWDVSWGKKAADDWSDKLAKVRAQHLEALDRLVLLRSEQEQRSDDIRALDSRIVLLQSPAEHELACIAIDVDCTTDCDASFVIDYVVPGACWRPYHSARLVGTEEGRVVFKTDACVWQNTGEDWEDVQLVLSTERASLGAESPTLVTDFLSLKRKTEALQIEARDEVVESLVDEEGTETTASQVPGIDDGGSTLSIKVPMRASISTDGRPHRFYLSEFESSAKGALLAMPEINPCVHLVTNLENAGSVPLLAGPVDLIRKSGLVGRSKIFYVAAGERFDLGWGPEVDLRVHREVESTSETSRVLSSWRGKTHITHLRLSNIGQRSYTVRVTERVPISELDKVKIEVDLKKTTRQQEADKNGFVQWEVELGALSHEKLELHYEIKMHDDVQV